MMTPVHSVAPIDWSYQPTERSKTFARAKRIQSPSSSGMRLTRECKSHALKLNAIRGVQTRVQPRDFLIVPWGKQGMSAYTEALEKYGIPYQVSGGNPLSHNTQLASLVDCLRAIDDPTNPVHYLSVLRGFFGFSDRELYVS